MLSSSSLQRLLGKLFIVMTRNGDSVTVGNLKVRMIANVICEMVKMQKHSRKDDRQLSFEGL